MRTIKNPAAKTPILTISPEKSEVHTSVLYAIQIIVCMVF